MPLFVYNLPNMGKKLIVSQRLDRLVDSLVEELEMEGGSPLTSKTILVKDSLLKSWLAPLLAERLKKNVFANYKMVTASDWIGRKFPKIPRRRELFLFLYQAIAESPDKDLAEFVSKKTSRRCALAEEMAEIFLRYNDFGTPNLSGWQKGLFEALFVKGPFEPPENFFRKEALSLTPIYCFDLDFLPPKYWEFLLSHPKICICQFSPCLYFCEDVCTNWEKRGLTKKILKEKKGGLRAAELAMYLEEAPSLLANLGKLGREALKAFDREDIQIEEAYDFFTPNTLLEKVQCKLLYFETDKEEVEEKDSSIKIVKAGAFSYQEVERLCQEIIDLAEQGCPFSQMRVVVPDCSLYAPLISLLFSSHGIPYKIFGVDLGAKSFFLKGVVDLFSLLEGPWREDLLYPLFDNPRFYKKVGLDQRGKALSKEWIKVVLDQGKEALFDQLLFFQEKQIEIADMERLENFLKAFANLEALYKEPREKDLLSWTEEIEKIGNLLEPEDEDEADTFALNFLKELMESLKKGAPLFEKKTFPLEVIATFLKQPLFSAIYPNSLHTVTVVPLSQGAIAPVRALFFVGLDEESFPRFKMSSSLDLLKKAPLYVPDGFDQDRYLFLQALFAAKERLYISFCHLSKEEGKPLSPAGPVQELLAFIDSSFSLKEEDLSEELYGESIKSQGSGKKGILNWHEAKSADEEADSSPQSGREPCEIKVSISDLVLLAKNPWKFYFRKKYGLSFYDEETNFLLEKSRILQKGLKSSFQEAPLDFSYSEGPLKEALKLDVTEEQQKIEERLRKWGVGPLYTAHLLETCREKKSLEEHPALIVLLEGVKVKLTGELGHLTSLGLVYMGKDDMEGLLKVWPEWLIASILLEKGELFCLKTEKVRTIQSPYFHLQKFLRYYFLALLAPSPLLPIWGEALLRKEGSVFEKKVEELASSSYLDPFYNPFFEWVFSRAGVPKAEEMASHWKKGLQETFKGLIELFEKSDD